MAQKMFSDIGARIYPHIKGTPRIPEMDFGGNLEFIVSTKEDVLYPLIWENDVIVVAGAFFGDEGKGKNVLAVAKHPKIYIIMRSNSGENAGHTVYDENGVKYVFHLAPSGLLIPGKKNLIGQNCVMDPVTFMNEEIQALVDGGKDYSNLFVGNVQIVTPYHKIIDALGDKNTSTLKGMSPAHASKVTKKGLRLDDLFMPTDHQAKILRRDMNTYRGLLNVLNADEEELAERLSKMNADGRKRIPEHIIHFLKAADKVDYLITLYASIVTKNPMFPNRADVTRMMQKSLEEGRKLLLEGPQGFYLSNSVETDWRSSTSADTTAVGIIAAAGYNTTKYRTVVINVHKTPASSRVGAGANPSGYVPQNFFSDRNINSMKDLEGICDYFDAIQKKFFDSIQENGILNSSVVYSDESGEYTIDIAMAIASSKKHGEQGATTGKPRICGFFDCVKHHKVNLAQGPYLSISAVDRGDDYDKVGLVIGYVVYNQDTNARMISNGIEYKNGDIIKAGDTIPSENVLNHCYPIIKAFEGWKGNPIEFSKRKEDNPLPKQLQDFLGAIKHYTGAEIISIGNGRRTENVIYLKQRHVA